MVTGAWASGRASPLAPALRRGVEALRGVPLVPKPLTAAAMYAALPLLSAAKAVPWQARQAVLQARFDPSAIFEEKPAPLADVPEDYLRTLRRSLEEVSTWVTGHTERVSFGLETRCQLHHLGDDLTGSLRLYWEVLDPFGVEKLRPWATRRFNRLELEASLPPWEVGTPGDDDERLHLHLRPDRGLRDLIHRFVELEVGEPRLDDAFIIKGDPGAGLAAIAVGHHLLVLRRFGAKIGIGPRALLVRVEPLAGQPREVKVLADTVFHLWRELALIRAGAHPGDA